MLAFGNVLMHGTQIQASEAARSVPTCIGHCPLLCVLARSYGFVNRLQRYANRRLGTENRLNMRFVLVSPDLAGQFVLVSAR